LKRLAPGNGPGKKAVNMIGSVRLLLFGIAVAAMASTAAGAAGPMLTVVVDQTTLQFDRDALLARPDAADISIPHDVAYGASMVFRAVPLPDLLAVATSRDLVLEAEAEDGFVAELPLEQVNNRDPQQAIAFLAIETADRPWPVVAAKERSAGPYYIVWRGAAAAAVPAFQWPYQVFRLTVQEAPTKRWPGLAVDRALPALAPVRAGQSLFVRTCFTCHSLNRAGLASVGPDLNLPMNPTEFFTEAGLRSLIRDPRAVRTWPEQRMPGFTAEQLSDEEIGLIVAYLRHMAGRKMPPAEEKPP
jgi:mono/diheme cytochrome c family protein